MPSTPNDTRLQVFISYSHEPPENAEFVRDLAGWLSVAGFAVWLDEQEIPGAAQIDLELKKAIDESEVGLFVVTSQWIKREWTQHEVRLFARRPDSRRLVVLREKIDLGDLGPHLGGLKVVSWPAGDDERDARHWEIYCGVTNTPPGPREQWALKARNIPGGPWNLDGSRGSAEPVVPAEVPETQLGFRPGERLALPCSGKPIASLVGERWTFLVTDQGEWVGIAVNGQLHSPLTRLSNHVNAAFSASGELLVGLCEPIVARLRGKHWEYLPQEAPVLCFANSSTGDVAGNAAGGLKLIDTAEPAPVFRIRDPIAALAGYDDGLVILGSRGIFGSLSWPCTREDDLSWIDTANLSRPVGLFRAVEYDHVGVYSATQIGELDTKERRISVCEQTIDEGIREVVFLGARSRPYAILTDLGSLLLVDAGFGTVRKVRLPRDSFVRGCCDWQGEVLAWTSEGKLYSLSVNGGTEEIADGVTMAYEPQPATGVLHVVRWNPETGASVERLTP